MRGSLPSWTASVPSADTRYYLLDSVDLARLKFYQVAEFSYCNAQGSFKSHILFNLILLSSFSCNKPYKFLSFKNLLEFNCITYFMQIGHQASYFGGVKKSHFKGTSGRGKINYKSVIN